MSSSFGVVDSLLRERDVLKTELDLFLLEATKVVDDDREVLQSVHDEKELNRLFYEWVDTQGLELAALSPDARANLMYQFRQRLLSNAKARDFMRARHDTARRLHQDVSYLISRLHHKDAAAALSPLHDDLQRDLLSMSSALHTVWDRLAARVATLNTAMGVLILGPAVEWDPTDHRRHFIPSDYSVPMMSQRFCALEEIRELEPKLQEAIEHGHIHRAVELGGRIAGLKASLKLVTVPATPAGPFLSIAWC